MGGRGGKNTSLALNTSLSEVFFQHIEKLESAFYMQGITGGEWSSSV